MKDNPEHDFPALDFEGLLDELKNPNDHRRDDALMAAYRLKVLVNLRASANGTTFHDEWMTIFDQRKLETDVSADDPELADAAFEVLDAVNEVEANRCAEDTSRITPEVRAWADQLRAKIAHKIEELRHQRVIPKN